MTEHALGGGNVAAAVVRVGNTVRKPAGFWTPSVRRCSSTFPRPGSPGRRSPWAGTGKAGRCSSTSAGRWRPTSRRSTPEGSAASAG